MDTVEIRGLSCNCVVGILPRERRVLQQVRVDLELFADLERAGKSGRIGHTVDYSRVSDELISLLQFRRYTLLEVAAEECAAWLFAAHPLISRLALRIEKPQALAGRAASGGVRIERQRPPEATRRSTRFGFVEPLLETNEASIALVGLEPGATLGLGELAAERALVMALSGRLSGTPILAHYEPRALHAEGYVNQDVTAALLVVCSQASTH